MSTELYSGPVPDGFIRITPKGELGTVTIRASKVEAVMQTAEAGALISPEGETTLDYFTVIVGVLAGKRFSFRVEEEHAEIMAQLQENAFQVVMEEMHHKASEVLPPEEGGEEPSN